jgi:hypothetical protein
MHLTDKAWCKNRYLNILEECVARTGGVYIHLTGISLVQRILSGTSAGSVARTVAIYIHLRYQPGARRIIKERQQGGGVRSANGENMHLTGISLLQRMLS